MLLLSRPVYSIPIKSKERLRSACEGFNGGTKCRMMFLEYICWEANDGVKHKGSAKGDHSIFINKGKQ